MKNRATSINILLYLVLLSVSLLMSSCLDEFGCVSGYGDYSEETRFTSEFIGLDLKVPAKVIITQGNQYSVVIDTYKNLQSYISTSTNKNTLSIESDRCINAGGDDILIYITAPDFASLRIYGSGEIVSANTLSVPDIELYISGSGRMDLDLVTDLSDTRISGSGKIILEGEAFQHDIVIDGSGSIHAFNLNTSRTNIEISGSGSCQVFAQNRLTVNISGSGVVWYKGHPIITSKISGTGSIINAN